MSDSKKPQNGHSWHTQPEVKSTLLGIKTLLFINKIIGERLVRLFIFIIMFFYWCFGTKAKLASKDYLSTLLAFQKNRPQQKTLSPQKLSTFRHFVAFGNALFDKLLCWSGKITLEDVTIYQSEFRLTEKNHQKGILILGSHLGNIEVCRALAKLETTQKIHVLMHTEQTQKFNAILKSLNPQSQINLVSVSNITPETMIFLKSVLEKGDYVALLADRLPVSTNHHQSTYITKADFLGRPAYFPKGPFILTLLLNVPTYFMVGLKLNNRYHIHLKRLNFPNEIKRYERDATIDDLTAQYISHLTHFCLQAPLQWFNFYYFWQCPESEGSQHE